VFLEEAADEAGEGGHTACPFEQRGLGRGLRIPEPDVPVAARTEGLVLGLPATTEAVVLEGGALDTRYGVAVVVGEREAAGDAVGAVLGHLDRRFPNALIDVFPCLAPVDGEAQGARWAVADRLDQLVHPCAARADEGVAARVERCGQPVGAKAGVGADAPVVEDGDPLADVGVAAVGDARGVLGAAEPDLRVPAVAERLHRRAATRAEGHLGPHLDPFA
jgi:hypothetical protein